MKPRLNKTLSQLQNDWEEVANSENYRNAIARGYVEEMRFRGIGESQTRAILKYIAHYGITIKDKQIAEIGCGAGRITEFLAKEAKFIYATDIAKRMLERFKERLGELPNVTLIHSGDLTKIPTNSIDVILSFLVFQHIPESIIEKLFEDSIRILKPNGYLIFQLTTLLKHQVIKSKHGATDMVRWTIEELIEIAKKNKFEFVNPITSWLKIWRKPNEL